MKPKIDLNADLGEGMSTDPEMMPLITSANVCCAAHAGDSESIRRALILAKEHRVAVGAHVGYFDRENFGRTNRPISPESCQEAFTACLFQIGGLIRFAKHFGVKVKYVKPHGALYNQASQNLELGRAVMAACLHFQLPIVILAGSPFHKKLNREIEIIPEGFADRAYQKDGTLVPRSEPGAILQDVPMMVKQVDWLIAKKAAATICLHGDSPDAVKFTAAIHEALRSKGYRLKAF